VRRRHYGDAAGPLGAEVTGIDIVRNFVVTKPDGRINAQNQGTNGGTSIPATFLKVTVSV
jgi:hypothetical protein